MKKFSIAYSTCPNDTFIFYALVKGKLKDSPFIFNEYLADIEELNSKAFNEAFEITKLSFNALGYLQDKYTLLDSGAALGENCGPLLVSKRYRSVDELKGKTVAVPGEHTTANFLFNIAIDTKTFKRFVRFDNIINEILSGKADAGVIIHESRFTYKEFGLHCLLDLGEWWENSCKLPIPLGGIAVSNRMEDSDIKTLDKYLKLSIKYAFNNFDEVKNYIKNYAQELDETVIKSHIDLYVNDYTYSLGQKGVEAVKFFIAKGVEKNIFSNNKLKICGTIGFYT